MLLERQCSGTAIVSARRLIGTPGSLTSIGSYFSELFGQLLNHPRMLCRDVVGFAWIVSQVIQLASDFGRRREPLGTVIPGGDTNSIDAE
jgi:hypothetical protein